jgi:four helix bundle protein
MAIERFQQLEVWQGAHGLVLQVYKQAATMPSVEKFGLVSQMRRAAVSVPANIAEGFKRRGRADKSRFYNIAQASLEELRYYFVLCRDLGYRIAYGSLAEQADHVARMLHGLVTSVENKK